MGDPSFSHPIISQRGLKNSYVLQKHSLTKIYTIKAIFVTFIKSEVYVFFLCIGGLWDHILNIL